MISALPPGWSEATLGDLVTIHDSRRIPLNKTEREARPGPYAYYGANGIVDYIDGYLFDGHYILIAEDGGYFDDALKPVAYEVSGKFWVNNHAHVLEPRGDIEHAYIRYYLNSANLMPFVSGTTRLKLTQDKLKKIPVPLAPVAERRKIIAGINKTFDHLLTFRTDVLRIPALARNMQNQIAIQAFTGQLTASWRTVEPTTENATSLLRQIISELSNTGHKAKVQGKIYRPAIEIPASWTWTTVDQIAYLIQYGTSAQTRADVSGVPVLRMGNIVDGQIDYSNLKYLEKDDPTLSELLLEPGDLLFNRTNSASLVGKTAVYDASLSPCSFASYLIRIRVKGLLPDLLSAYINSKFGRDWIGNVVSQQVGQANVNSSKLRSLAVPLPPEAEQHEISRRLRSATSALQTASREVNRISSLGDRLKHNVLIKAFRGELHQDLSYSVLPTSAESYDNVPPDLALVSSE